jgi:hypothetical protein
MRAEGDSMSTSNPTPQQLENYQSFWAALDEYSTAVHEKRSTEQEAEKVCALGRAVAAQRWPEWFTWQPGAAV